MILFLSKAFGTVDHRYAIVENEEAKLIHEAVYVGNIYIS